MNLAVHDASVAITAQATNAGFVPEWFLPAAQLPRSPDALAHLSLSVEGSLPYKANV